MRSPFRKKESPQQESSNPPLKEITPHVHCASCRRETPPILCSWGVDYPTLCEACRRSLVYAAMRKATNALR